MIALGWFDVNFCPMTMIKGQALATFIAEFTYASTTEVAGTINNVEAAKTMEARDKEGSTLTRDET